MYYIGLSILGLIILGNFFTLVIQDWFIFRPIPLLSSTKFKFDAPFEELYLETPHLGKINMLWFHRKGVKRPLVLYSHGNSSNLKGWADEYEFFDSLGYDFLIYDYRGFGKSRGLRNEANFYFDALAIYDFAREHYAAEDIVLYGRSMGTGVTSMLAAEREAKVCILETPYHSIPQLFKSYYPFLPLFLFRFKYNFYVNEWVQKANCDLYVFQGTKDVIVPYRCSVKLKPLLKDPNNYITIEGGKHNNLGGYDEYKDKIKSLLL